MEISRIHSSRTEDGDNFRSVQEEVFSKILQEKESHILELNKSLKSIETQSSSQSNCPIAVEKYEKEASAYMQKINKIKEKLDILETEKVQMIKERDQAKEDLRNVESAFSDVQKKYERSKEFIRNLKVNQDTLVRKDQEMMEKILSVDKKIEALKQTAHNSLEQMYLGYANKIRDFEDENVRLKAQIRKVEMKLDTLQNEVGQKAKENTELNALCDELINGQVKL